MRNVILMIFINYIKNGYEKTCVWIIMYSVGDSRKCNVVDNRSWSICRSVQNICMSVGVTV